MTNSRGRQPDSPGGAIRDFRRRAGLSQHELADRAGMSVGAVRDLEQRRVTAPRPATVSRLISVLALSTTEAAELSRLGPPRPSADDPRVLVLGPLRVMSGATFVELRSPLQRGLLGRLALTPNTPVPAETLIEAMWGERQPANAVGLLQTHVSRLRQWLHPPARRALLPDLVTSAPGGYQLTAAADQLDLLSFRDAIDRARASLRDGDPESAMTRYAEATGLWRGEPVADVPSMRGHPSVVAIIREWRDVVVDFADTAATIGRHGEALPLLRQIAEADGLHEAAHARLMVALAADGQQADALRVFDQLRHRLADDLGVDPGPEAMDAYQRVLRQEVVGAAKVHATPVSAHRQLPPDITDFVGRDAELCTVLRAARGLGTGSAAPRIMVIHGMGGVGKTRLAVHCAHELVRSGGYGDLQLYVDLRGYSHDSPADPATVLGSFLRLMGVPGAAIPDDLDGRAALYRDRLHDRRVLVLLDNAAGGQQVLPLLPASATALVLITSRGTVAVDGADTIPLDVFSAAEADRLLTRIVGSRRVAADPVAARRLIDLCGRLPLAVALAARRLRSRPALRLVDLVGRLERGNQRLDELSVGDRQVRAVFDLSIRALDAGCQRLFRALGVHPGDDFTAESAAALSRSAPVTAARLLDRLIDEHLVVQITADRYAMHDLLRQYARGEADDRAESDAAVSHVLVWHLYAADAAVRALFPHQRDVRLDDRLKPSPLPSFEDGEQALRWLTAEHATLVACVDEAFARGRYDAAWQLPTVLRQYFDCYSHRRDWLRTNRIALEATRRRPDRAAEALVLSTLGLAYGQVNRLDQAADSIGESLSIRRALGDREGEGKSLNNLGIVHARRGSLNQAVECFRAALDIRRELGSWYHETITLNNLGRAYAEMHRHEDAVACFQQVVDVRSRLGDRIGLASVLYNLGEALLHAGQRRPAIARLREALALAQEMHLRGRAAETLDLLGQALSVDGEFTEAEECWREAVRIFEELGNPQAQEVRLLLDQATGRRSTIPLPVGAGSLPRPAVGRNG